MVEDRTGVVLDVSGNFILHTIQILTLRNLSGRKTHIGTLSRRKYLDVAHVCGARPPVESRPTAGEKWDDNIVAVVDHPADQ